MMTKWDILIPFVKFLELILKSLTRVHLLAKRFYLKVKTLTLILHSNLYPLTNMGFINLGRAGFLCDLIIGAQIDIYAHIFQILGKMASQSAARTCLPFCNLIMKILLLKGIRPPKNGIVLPRQGPTLSHKHV